jgi:hypothetical protein
MNNLDKQSLRTEIVNDVIQRVLFGNKLVGSFIMDVDGYYYFEKTTQGNGFWTSHSLRMIADLLDSINKPHNDKIKEYFKNEL